MADILKSLGDAIERQQQRRHENNMEVLRAIYTRPGMIVLGVILLGAVLALICPRTAPEKEVNGVVIELESGEIVFDRCLPVGLVMDERIAAGSYFARAFHVFKRYIKNPALLEEPPKEVKIDE